MFKSIRRRMLKKVCRDAIGGGTWRHVHRDAYNMDGFSLQVGLAVGSLSMVPVICPTGIHKVR